MLLHQASPTSSRSRRRKRRRRANLGKTVRLTLGLIHNRPRLTSEGCAQTRPALQQPEIIFVYSQRQLPQHPPPRLCDTQTYHLPSSYTSNIALKIASHVVRAHYHHVSGDGHFLGPQAQGGKQTGPVGCPSVQKLTFADTWRAQLQLSHPSTSVCNETI